MREKKSVETYNNNNNTITTTTTTITNHSIQFNKIKVISCGKFIQSGLFICIESYVYSESLNCDHFNLVSQLITFTIFKHLLI